MKPFSSLLLTLDLTFLSIFPRQTMKHDTFPLPQTNSRSFKKSLTYLALAVLGTGVGVGGTLLVQNPQLLARSIEVTSQAQEPPSDRSVAAITPSQADNFVTDVVQQVGPSVVRIDASRTVQTEDAEMSDDPFFGQFFGSQVPDAPKRQIQRGSGSGFILNEDGEIMTNAHVVDGADKVTVTLKDGRSFTGKVLGSDPVTDVAVVKIEASDLNTVRMGDSDRLQVGEWAIAIGNPLGLDNTVTTGIVSATGRSSAQVGVGDKRIDFIQTDAAINPGNSGGPLLNANGEVIGINTAIIQNAQGLGFAIPINQAQQIAQQLIEHGSVEHAYLGIQMVKLTPEIQQQIEQEKGWNLQATEGVLIVRVMPNSPANRAGFQAGDILISVNNQPVSEPAQVQKLIEQMGAGKTLSASVDRQGKTTNLDVEVGVLPENIN